MKLVYIHSEENIEVLAEVVTNHSITVEEAIEATGINLDAVLGEDYDYNALAVQA